MFSAILDVALGIVLVYLILSITASALSEVVNNTILNQRGNFLKTFIAGLLANSAITINDFYKTTLIASQMEGKRYPTYIKAEDFTQTIFDLLRQKYTNGAAIITVQDAQNIITEMPSTSPLREVLNSFLAKTLASDPTIQNIDAQQLSMYFQNWFDNSMDRVSGWFTRHTKIVLLVIGLGIAGAFNVDTIEAVNYLLQNPAAREVVAAQAKDALQTSPQVTASDPTAQLRSLNEQLHALDMPIGWPDPYMPDNEMAFATHLTSHFGWWLKKLLGIIITGLAVSQGAPFWFDLLNKITNLRSTGKPPDKAPVMDNPAAPVSPAKG
ncbi:MAG: hypothetical protein ABI947_04735 [Chloroflexota bacterium]